MTDRELNRMCSSKKNKYLQRSREARYASMETSGLHHNLDYYTWPMLHKAYTGELNELGIRVEEEKRRRGLI